jgi:hypothetical protein
LAEAALRDPTQKHCNLPDLHSDPESEVNRTLFAIVVNQAAGQGYRHMLEYKRLDELAPRMMRWEPSARFSWDLTERLSLAATFSWMAK